MERAEQSRVEWKGVKKPIFVGISREGRESDKFDLMSWIDKLIGWVRSNFIFIFIISLGWDEFDLTKLSKT